MRQSLRQDVLGESGEPGDGFGASFQDFAGRVAWGDDGPWARPGLDRRARFLVALTALAVGGHLGELAAHARAALRGGLTADEMEETLLHASLYCGLPAAAAAVDVVRRVVTEEGPA